MKEGVYVGRMTCRPIPDPSSKAGMRLSYRPVVRVYSAPVLGTQDDPLEGDRPSFQEDLISRNDLIHFKATFDWGNLNDGARKLALALLASAVGESPAVRLYERFAQEEVATLTPAQPWMMSSESILAWVSDADVQQSKSGASMQQPVGAPVEEIVKHDAHCTPSCGSPTHNLIAGTAHD